MFLLHASQAVALALAIVGPVSGHDYGWIFRVPTVVPKDGTSILDSKRKLRARDLRVASQWESERSFDSAAACEAYKEKRQKSATKMLAEAVDVLMHNMGVSSYLGYQYAKCVPAYHVYPPKESCKDVPE